METNQLLHVIYYKAMIGNYDVVEKHELHYGTTETENSLARIKDYYKDDLIEYKIFGPTDIIGSYKKYPSIGDTK